MESTLILPRVTRTSEMLGAIYRPVGLQPTDLIRGHPRIAAGVLPASTVDTRHKATAVRFSILPQPRAGAGNDRHNQSSPWPDQVRLGPAIPAVGRPSRAPCQAPHPAREPGQRQRRDPTPRFGLAGEAEAEELARRRARHRALGTVDPQLRCRVRKRSTLAMTRSPARRLCTSMLQSPPS